MKFFIFTVALVALCSAEPEEKKTEKRGVVGLGYGYGGLPLGGYGPGLGGLGYHGLPYSSALPLTHGYAAPAIHAPILAKAIAPIAPIAPISYASPFHAPIISKTIAPVSHFGYTSPYLGYNHGLPYYH